ncbi:adhesive plaque matrix protein-like [Syngnathus acus]|uniref:adhesive plaque matrix protein-like n=1 Tax=Syngnathus acus TaxID=161584 RepID=UPI001886008A|nr:adhesive plaque matrix protein-like [Syngnathus acus]
MGPGLAARFSWICLLIISNAASVPVQQKYSLRPPFKSNSGPPEDLRPSLMSVQQTYSHGFPKGQSAEPTSGSWSQSSPATSDAHLAAYAGNSNQHSSAPAHADSQFAKPVLSGSRWPLSAQTSKVIPSNAGHQASMAMAEHPGIQHHHSWESYTPVHEQPSGSKPSTHQVKDDSLEGRQTAYPGSNLPSSLAEYLSEYEPLSGHEAPTVPVVLPGGEKGTPSHTAKGQPASVVGGGLPQNWPLYEQTSSIESPTASESPVSGKGDNVAHSGGHRQSWAVGDVQPSGYRPATGLVQVDTVMGKLSLTPSGSLPPTWPLFNPVYEPPSNYELPTAPENPAGKGHHVFSGGKKGWSASSPFDQPRPIHEPSPAQVDTVKGQQVRNAAGKLPPSWAVYTQVFSPSAAPEIPPKVSPGTGEEQEYSRFDVKPPSYKPGKLPPTWAQVYSSPAAPEIPPKVSPGAGEEQEYSRFDVKPPSYKPGKLPPTWAQVYSSPAAPEIPPKGVKLSPITGITQLVSPPGGHVQQSWSAYSRFEQNPIYEPSTAEVDSGHGQQVWNEGGHLPPTWAQVYSSPAAPEIPPKVSPGAGEEQEYSRFDVKPPSYKPGKLPPTWAQVYSSPAAPEIPPKGVKLSPITGITQLVSPPGGHVQQSWSAYSRSEQNPIYEPSTAEVDSGHGQQVWNEGGHLPPTWAQGYSPPAVPEFPNKGVKVSPGGHVQQSWSAYSPFEEHPSYEPSTTEVDSGHGQQVWNEGGHLPPTWAQGFSPEVPTKVSPSTPYWSTSSPFEEEHPIYEPSPAEVDSVQRRQVWNVGGNLPQSWAIYKQVFYPPATSKIPPRVSPGTGERQLAPHRGVNFQQRWSAYSPLDVQHPSYEHSPAEVDTVHGQQVWNEGGHLPPTWAQGFTPPAAPEVSPGLGEGPQASHQRWSASSKVEQAPRYKPSPALHPTTGSGRKAQPSWSKVGSPPGKGQLAESQSGNWHPDHMTPATGGVQVDTAQKQPRWAATSPFKFPGPSSYKPSGGATPNQHLEANPGGSPLTKVQVGPLFGKGQPASGPAGRWPAYGSASHWSPSFKPSVIPGGAAAGKVTEWGRKPASTGVPSAHVPDHASSYKPSRLPTDSGVKGQPAHPDSNWHSAGHRLFPRVDPDHHGTSQLEGSDPAAGVSTWNVHQSSSSDPSHPSKGSGHLSEIPGAPWVFDEFPGDYFDEEQHNEEVDDAAGDMEIEGKMEVPTYIVRNRNGYEQERKELSQMHYTQRVAYPYVPSQRLSTKIL